MINSKKNIFKILKVALILIMLFSVYIIAYVRVIPDRSIELYKKYFENEVNIEEITENSKGIQKRQTNIAMIIISYSFLNYLFFNLSERWLLKNKKNIVQCFILVLLKVLSIVCISLYIYITIYSYIKNSYGFSLGRQILQNIVVWLDCISTIFWVGLLCYIAKNEKNIKTYIFEKIYTYIRRVFIFLFILIEVYVLVNVKDNYYRDINRETFRKMGHSEQEIQYDMELVELAGDYNTEMIELFSGILIVIGVMYLNIYGKTKKIVSDILKNKYNNKDLIIYYNPWFSYVTPYTTSGLLAAKRDVKLNVSDKTSKYLLEDEYSVFVDYRAIENNIIDTSKFKSVIHVFEYEDDSEQYCEKTYINKFIKLIEDCENKEENYIIVNSNIYEHKENLITNAVKDKYYYAYIDYADNWHKAVTSIDKEVDKKITNIANSISTNKSCEFIKNTLKSINESDNNIEKFYKLLKISEYIIQYEALYYIAKNKMYENFKSDDNFFRYPTLGYWDQVKSNDDLIIPEDTINRVQNLLEELDIKVPDNINLFSLKHLITQIHNSNLGHGSISYYISKKYNKLLVEIVNIFVQDFDNKNISINGMTFIDSKGRNVDLLIVEDDQEYMYSGMIYGTIEYFCFENGQSIKKYINGAKKLILNLGEDHIL